MFALKYFWNFFVWAYIQLFWNVLMESGYLNFGLANNKGRNMNLRLINSRARLRNSIFDSQISCMSAQGSPFDIGNTFLWALLINRHDDERPRSSIAHHNWPHILPPCSNPVILPWLSWTWATVRSQLSLLMILNVGPLTAEVGGCEYIYWTAILNKDQKKKTRRGLRTSDHLLDQICSRAGDRCLR